MSSALISAKKNEPEWMLEWRLKAYRHWLQDDGAGMGERRLSEDRLSEHHLLLRAEAKRDQGRVSTRSILHCSRRSRSSASRSPNRRCWPDVAVDAIFDSVSVATTFKEKLAEAGVIFCSFSEAVRNHPEIIQKYLGSVVPYTDNYFAALNSAVFSDGSFCYIPKGVRCPMELSSYFRINNSGVGTVRADVDCRRRGCAMSPTSRDVLRRSSISNQLHAAVVELVALDDAEIKYSTVQNWYAGDEEGKGGIFNFVTKRGKCLGRNSKISWTQVETGSAITWKYPSCILQGDNSIGEFYSVALTNHRQQADTGTKMIHIGKNTRSRIISKGISAGRSTTSYRGLVKILPKAEDARNYSQCDSLLDRRAMRCEHVSVYRGQEQHARRSSTKPRPRRSARNRSSISTSAESRPEDAVSMIINGFCKEVFRELPMEFAVEATRLLGLKLEGSVG